MLAAAIVCTPLAAQQAPPDNPSSSAVVTFTVDFPQSDPTHYSIAVDARGHARYECTAKVTDDSDAQTYRAEFDISARNRDRIFELARQAKYFSGQIDSGNHKLAFTGAKILSYEDGRQSSTARYNFSNLQPVRQLTELFQSIAATVDYGRRLAYYHRYQKLGLDDELKRMEEQAKSNQLSEIQGVAPVLQEILDDTSVMNVVRARAKELIEMGRSSSGR
jgi:hypothetical protein